MIDESASLQVGWPNSKVLGQLSPEAAIRLDAAGTDSTQLTSLLNDTRLRASRSAEMALWPWGTKEIPIYLFTDYTFGFVAKRASAQETTEVIHAGQMDADFSLKGASLLITLDRLRVAEYPGNSCHNILFDFYGQHQTTGGSLIATHAQLREGSYVAVQVARAAEWDWTE